MTEVVSNNKISFNALHYGLLVFLAIVFVNSSKLTNPPYWDDIIGLHNQAIFIAKHNFNPIALWNDKPIEVQGLHHNPLATNSNVYPYSITPWIHAVFYKLLPPHGAHCAGHLFNMLCLSIAAAMAYAIIARHKGKLIAAMIPLIALLEPIMAGRTAALCQECPLAAMTMLAFYFLDRGKMTFAIVAAFLSIFIKPTGVVLLLVLGAFSLVTLLVYHKELKRIERVLFLLGLVLVVVVGGIVLRPHIMVDSLTLQDIWFYIRWRTPAIILYVSLSILIATGLTVYALVRQKPFNLHEELTSYRLCSLIFIWGMLCAMIIMPVVPPRYMTFCIFPTFVLVGLAIGDLNKAAFLLVPMAIMFIWHPMPKLARKMQRSGEYLERSREYLEDLETHKIICEIFTKEVDQDRPAVVKWPFGQMLTMPEFGYVDKPRPNTYVAENVVPKYAPVIQADTYEKLPQNGVYLFTASSISYMPPILLPEDEPKIIFKDNKLEGDAFIFMLQK